eukprot:2862827-Alexandrium_andersonii.AAC.1
MPAPPTAPTTPAASSDCSTASASSGTPSTAPSSGTPSTTPATPDGKGDASKLNSKTNRADWAEFTRRLSNQK